MTRGAALALLVVAEAASAERLYLCGHELRTTRAGVETDPGAGATSDAGATVDSSPGASPHGGTAVGRAVAIAGQRSSFRHFFLTSTPALYARVYVRVDQPVSARTMFLLVRRSSAVPPIAWLTIEPGNVVRPRVWVTDWPSSVTLTTGQWHRIDLFVDERPASGSHRLELALDGTPFVVAQNQAFSHVVDTLELGLNVNAEAVGTGVMSFDDIAVNGAVGTVESSYPGPGRIIVLRPSGPAGIAQWPKSDGGPPAQTNWLDVSEVSPDDAASALSVSTNQNTEDEYEVDAPPAEAADAGVRLVAVSVRFQGAGTMPSSLAVAARSGSGGAQQQSANIATNDTRWFTNRVDGYLNVPLVMATTPEGQPWTAATLDTLRIGIVDADSSARGQSVTAVWASAELTASDEPPSRSDGGAPDAGSSDGGAADAGSVDAGAPDAGAIIIADGGETVADGGLPTPDAGTQLEPRHLQVGCGCQAGAPGALLLALAWWRRRRRRQQGGGS